MKLKDLIEQYTGPLDLNESQNAATVGSALFGPVGAAVGANKGKRLRSAVGSTIGGVGGAALGALPGALTFNPALAGVGAGIGGIAGRAYGAHKAHGNDNISKKKSSKKESFLAKYIEETTAPLTFGQKAGRAGLIGVGIGGGLMGLRALSKRFKEKGKIAAIKAANPKLAQEKLEVEEGFGNFAAKYLPTFTKAAKSLGKSPELIKKAASSDVSPILKKGASAIGKGTVAVGKGVGKGAANVGRKVTYAGLGTAGLGVGALGTGLAAKGLYSGPQAQRKELENQLAKKKK